MNLSIKIFYVFVAIVDDNVSEVGRLLNNRF